MSGEDEASREAILARRRRFLALALGGATVTSACAAACLSTIDAGRDAGDASTLPDAESTDDDAP
jgi:hypothetical protein